jgi:hypothetical protein
VKVRVDILTGSDRWAAEAHANALYQTLDPLRPDDVETLLALLATPEAWPGAGSVRDTAATAVLHHAFRADDPALVTRVRAFGPFRALGIGVVPPPRCLRAALAGLGGEGLRDRLYRLRYWSAKVNVADFSVVADVLAGELGSPTEGSGRNIVAPGRLAATILLRSALLGRDPDALRAPLTGATDLPDRPTRAREALAALTGVEVLCQRFDAVRALAVGRAARRTAVVKGVVAAMDVVSDHYRIHGPQGRPGYPYAPAIAVAGELAATPSTQKLVGALRARHESGKLSGDLG